MLRYEYSDDKLKQKAIMFIRPQDVLCVQTVYPVRKNYCAVRLITGAEVTVPLSPDDFAAEVEEALALAPAVEKTQEEREALIETIRRA